MAALRRSFRSFRSGTALVEMVIVISVLLLLTMGLIEYGWLFVKVEQLNQIASQGARLAIRPDITNADVNSSVVAKLASVNLSKATIIISPEDVSTASPGSSISVELTMPYEDVALLHYLPVPVPEQIHTKVTMAKEGK